MTLNNTLATLMVSTTRCFSLVFSIKFEQFGKLARYIPFRHTNDKIALNCTLGTAYNPPSKMTPWRGQMKLPAPSGLEASFALAQRSSCFHHDHIVTAVTTATIPIVPHETLNSKVTNCTRCKKRQDWLLCVFHIGSIFGWIFRQLWCSFHHRLLCSCTHQYPSPFLHIRIIPGYNSADWSMRSICRVLYNTHQHLPRSACFMCEDETNCMILATVLSAYQTHRHACTTISRILRARCDFVVFVCALWLILYIHE